MRLEELLKLAGVNIAENRLNEIGEYDVVDDAEDEFEDDYSEEPTMEPEVAEPQPDPFADGPDVTDADIAAALNKWAPKPKVDPNAELAGPYDHLGGGREKDPEISKWADSEDSINLQKEIERKNAELARKKAEREARAAAMDSDFGAGEEEGGFDIDRLKKLSGI